MRIFRESGRPLAMQTLIKFGLLALCHIYFLQIYPSFVPPNELSRLLLVSAVVDDGTFQIDQAIRRYGDCEDKASFHGHSYSDKDIGMSLLGIPFYALLRLIETVFQIRFSAGIAIFYLRIFTITLPALLFLPVIARYWRRLRPDSQLVPHFLFMLTFGTIAFTYSVQFISHYLLGMLLFCAVILLAHSGENVKQGTTRTLILSGTCCGLALTMEYPAIFPVSLICLYSVWSVRNLRRILIFAAPILFFLCLILAYHYSIFGSPFDVPYRHATGRHIAQHATGLVGVGLPKPEALWGLFFSRHHGLFFSSPFLLFSIPGLFLLLRNRDRRAEALLFTGIILSIVLIYTGFDYWIGGWAFGPRYLAPAIPFLATGVFYFFTDPRVRSHRHWSITGLTAALLSVLLVTAGTITFPYPPDSVRDPLFFLCFPLMIHNGYGFNIGEIIGLQNLGPALLFFTILAITYLVVVVPKKRIELPDGRVLRQRAAAVAMAVVFVAIGFLTTPAPDAREYYARGLVYAFLTRYNDAERDMNHALAENPVPDLGSRIRHALSQVQRLREKD